jgi:hypothetical protein
MLLKKVLRSLNGQYIFSCEARSKVFELKETDRITELVKSTDSNIPNLFVSDASDTLRMPSFIRLMARSSL